MAKEVVLALDRMVSQAAPTEAAQKALMPDTFWKKLSVMRNYATGKAGPANVGDFLMSFAKTIQRERQLNRSLQIQAVNRLSSGYTWMIDPASELYTPFSDRMYNKIMSTFASEVIGGKRDTFLGPNDLFGLAEQSRNNNVPQSPSDTTYNLEASQRLQELDLKFGGQQSTNEKLNDIKKDIEEFSVIGGSPGGDFESDLLDAMDSE